MPVLLDALMSEYGQTLEYCTGRYLGQPRGEGLSLSQALMLYTQIALRYDNQPAGPDYREREMIQALHAAQNK